MDDFTLEMENLPIEEKYQGNEYALKACLCKHFEEIIKMKDL